MGVANPPDILQHNTNELFHEFGFIHTYIDEILILIKGDWTYHVYKLELIPNKLKEKGIRYNIENYFFEKIET